MIAMLLLPAVFVVKPHLYAADFVAEIAPLFEEHCAVCHSGEQAMAGFRLDGSEYAFRPAATGRTPINPGDALASELFRRISSTDPATRMPPSGEPLQPNEITAVRDWIESGAEWPASGVAAIAPDWAFQALTATTPPRSGKEGWARTPVDRFVLARLAEKGLTPAPEASRRTLIRRLTFDLLGLPPTPEEISTFLNDTGPSAYEDLVERLLASPHYGERWGRHWLDVVHYGESHGYDKDKPRRNAWPYRDYVIRSFNEDKPYAQFITEQLAGDYVWPDDPQALVATGFIAAGPWDYVGHAELREGTKDKKLARLLDRDDMLAATMSTFTSLTVHCARCHDHKFDPIRQADYYSAQAVFAGVDRADQPFDDDPAVHKRRRELWFALRDTDAALVPYREELSASTSPAIDELDRLAKRLRQQSADLLPKVGEVDTPERIARRKEISAELKEIGAERNRLARALLEPDELDELRKLESLRDQHQSALDDLPEPRYVYSAASYFKRFGTFTPAWEPRPVHLLERGSVESPGPPQGPGAVAAVPGLDARFAVEPDAPEGARRVALARWITDPANPLTWRSIVNRVWHYHVGRGLVDTPNDFGRMGSRPTHPKLLDWLAVRFRDGGGSIKDLHRLIVTSAAYRQSSAHNPANARIDTSNQYLWRMNRLRLDAESVRDAVLAVSGRLDLSMGGPPAEHFFFKDDHSPIYDYARFDVTSPAARRRGVYRFLVRSVQDPFMESLDCADPSLLVPKRNSTLTAIQALALLNDPLIVQESRHFAERMRQAASDPQLQIQTGFLLALGRTATTDEASALAEYASQHGLENAARLIYNMNEFLFVD